MVVDKIYTAFLHFVFPTMHLDVEIALPRLVQL